MNKMMWYQQMINRCCDASSSFMGQIGDQETTMAEVASTAVLEETNRFHEAKQKRKTSHRCQAMRSLKGFKRYGLEDVGGFLNSLVWSLRIAKALFGDLFRVKRCQKVWFCFCLLFLPNTVFQFQSSWSLEFGVSMISMEFICESLDVVRSSNASFWLRFSVSQF